eukprot:gene8206-11102_t
MKRTGGSASMRPTRRVESRQQSRATKMLKACNRAKEKLGDLASVDNIINSWAELNAVGRGDEMIKALINLNLSEIEIRSLLKCGSSRIQRIRKNPNLEETTLKQLHEEYQAAFDEQSEDDKVGAQKMQYPTFLQLLDFIVKNPASTIEQRELAVNEKAAHNGASIRDYALSLNLNIPPRNELNDQNPILPGAMDDPDSNENDINQRELQNGDLLLLAEDFGQGIALPH